MILCNDVSFDSETRKLSLLDAQGNELSSCIIPSKDNDDLTKPLMFKSLQDGSTVKLGRVGSWTASYQTSTDAETWDSYTLGTAITLDKGDVVYFRRSSGTPAFSRTKYAQFTVTGKIGAYNNVNSMLDADFSGVSDISGYGAYSLCRLFYQCGILRAPAFPATTLGADCYLGVFEGSSSLEKAPALPATTLTANCYQWMFKDCVALTSAPASPATVLSVDCYRGMFYNCTSLVNAPEISATTLAANSFNSMFKLCTALVKAPLLLATDATGVSSPYPEMFNGCTSLNEVRCALSVVDTPPIEMNLWLNDVSPTGDFYAAPNASWASGASGIPEGWVRHDIADYPQT